jgi:predicted DNA-binding ribbon-helix-helix protein
MHTVTFKSAVIKRSIVVTGHKTSVSLEDAFWKGLKEIAGGHHLTLSDLIAKIDLCRQHSNLSSAIRLFVLDFYRNQLSRFETSARIGWCSNPSRQRHGQAVTTISSSVTEGKLDMLLVDNPTSSVSGGIE